MITVQMKEIDKKIAALAAIDTPVADIARQVGLGRTSVYRHLEDDEVKDRLKAVQAELYKGETLEIAVKSFKNLIAGYPQDDPQLREHGYKSTVELLRSANVLSTNKPSVYIENVNNDNRQVISVTLQKILDEAAERDKSCKNLFEIE